MNTELKPIIIQGSLCYNGQMVTCLSLFPVIIEGR